MATEIAFASTYTPPNPVAATCRATSSAACGGHTDRITELRDTTESRPVPASSAASARPVVARLRPAGSHSTVCPAVTRQPPTAAPISPGCSSPTVAMRFLQPDGRCSAHHCAGSAGYQATWYSRLPSSHWYQLPGTGIGSGRNDPSLNTPNLPGIELAKCIQPMTLLPVALTHTA